MGIWSTRDATLEKHGPTPIARILHMYLRDPIPPQLNATQNQTKSLTACHKPVPERRLSSIICSYISSPGSSPSFSNRDRRTTHRRRQTTLLLLLLLLGGWDGGNGTGRAWVNTSRWSFDVGGGGRGCGCNGSDGALGDGGRRRFSFELRDACLELGDLVVSVSKLLLGGREILRCGAAGNRGDSEICFNNFIARRQTAKQPNSQT